MRINTLSNFYVKNYNNYNNTNKNNRDVQYTNPQAFTGLAIRLPMSRSKLSFIKHKQNLISSMLCMPSQEVKDLTKGNSLNRVDFLRAMAEKYNGTNYGHITDREDTTPVLNIYRSIRKVQPEHFDLLRMLQLPFEKLEKVFAVVGDKDKKLLQQVVNMHQNIFSEMRTPSGAESFYKIMDSKCMEEVVQNPKKYKSYILLNYKDENFADNLAKEVENKTFNPAMYDKKYNVKSIFTNGYIPETEILNKQVLENSYNKEGLDLLTKYLKIARLSEEAVFNGNDADMLKIYKSTNSKNYELRDKIVKNFAQLYTENSKTSKYCSETRDLSNLFDLLDRDKDSEKFVKHLIKDRYNISIESLFIMLKNIPSKKLNRFYGNVLNIERQTSSQYLVETLQKEIENPLYKSEHKKRMEKYGYVSKESYLTRKILSFKNKINMFMYKTFDKPNISAVEAEPLQIEKSEEVIVIPAPVLPELPIKKSLSKAERKILVSKDVNNVIEKHLTKRMLEHQQGIYSENATKMRLNLLPEIFNSISDTRKVDRMVGKTFGTSSNYDAVKLYQRINRNNKKVINYMLKKRNTDGSRMYDVKTIIAFIDKSEKRFSAAKKANPSFNSGNVKAYYNKMYDNMVEQYGKVIPLRSIKSSNKV